MKTPGFDDRYPVVNQEEASVDDMHEGQPTHIVDYDPAAVPTLSVEDMHRIEDAIYPINDASEAQELIDEELKKLGFDSNNNQDGILVVNIEGVDGKKALCAIVRDAGDFGTRLLNVELRPLSHSVNDVASEGSPLDESKSLDRDLRLSAEQEYPKEEGLDPENKRAQLAKLDAIKNELFTGVSGIERKIDEGAEQEHKGRHQLEEFIEKIDRLSNPLKSGGALDGRALESLINEYGVVLTQLGDYFCESSTEERRSSQNFSEYCQGAVSDIERNLDDDEVRTEALSTLASLQHQIEEVNNNRAIKAYAGSEFKGSIQTVLRILEDAQYDRRGFEAYGHQLSRYMAKIKEQVNQIDRQNIQIPELLADMKLKLVSNS